MKKHQRITTMIYLPVLFAACSEEERLFSAATWSVEQELIYQLQELIRYEDEQMRLMQEPRESLSATPIVSVAPES